MFAGQMLFLSPGQQCRTLKETQNAIDPDLWPGLVLPSFATGFLIKEAFFYIIFSVLEQYSTVYAGSESQHWFLCTCASAAYFC